MSYVRCLGSPEPASRSLAGLDGAWPHWALPPSRPATARPRSPSPAQSDAPPTPCTAQGSRPAGQPPGNLQRSLTSNRRIRVAVVPAWTLGAMQPKPPSRGRKPQAPSLLDHGHPCRTLRGTPPPSARGHRATVASSPAVHAAPIRRPRPNHFPHPDERTRAGRHGAGAWSGSGRRPWADRRPAPRQGKDMGGREAGGVAGMGMRRLHGPGWPCGRAGRT
jgi:hypothetical protein